MEPIIVGYGLVDHQHLEKNPGGEMSLEGGLLG